MSGGLRSAIKCKCVDQKGTLRFIFLDTYSRFIFVGISLSYFSSSSGFIFVEGKQECGSVGHVKIYLSRFIFLDIFSPYISEDIILS